MHPAETMSYRLFLSRVFNETCPPCKTIGIDITHSPETWVKIHKDFAS